ncbi:MAG TPA: hypothetical protein VIK18_06270, partial [Pirellulales bacterium]
MIDEAKTRVVDDPLELLWGRASAAGYAAAALACRPDADDDLALTNASAALGEAADELQRIRPNVIASAQALDLAAVISPLTLEEARRRLVAAIGSALADIHIDPSMSATETLAIGMAADLLGIAHHALTGRL